MKMATYRKIRLWLLSCLVFLTAALCALMGLCFNKTINTQAEEATVNRTLLAGEYQTNGASMRVFKQTTSGGFEATEQQGIRFHVEMGSGYKYGTTTLFDETTKNTRGSWKIEDGYKTYTLILPTRLLSGDLTVNTDKVMKLDTTDYWFTDENGNIESVAYLYDIPEKWHTDTFSFRGIICTVAADGTETVVVETETDERCLSYVAKMSYKDTVNPETVAWGTAERDEEAAPLIKAFVPTYTINYEVNGVTTTEEVLWGDKPQSVPGFTVTEDEYIEYTAGWYDETNKEEIDITSEMLWTESKEITLVQASATEFILTGVTDYNDFTDSDGAVYSGVKLYATLPTTDFFTDDQIANGTDELVPVSVSKDSASYEGSGTFGGLQGAWAMLEGAGGGAQMRIILAFDSSTMVNGDKLILKQDAAFYANNVMYTLSEKYTIDYSVVNKVEYYGVLLGYLNNSHIKSIENWDEYKDGTRLRIRVTFHDDLLINSDFTFVFDGELPEGYEYPVYTLCNDTGTATQITGGYYYWNEGANTILELDGYAYHNNDEIYGAPGTKIVQNGGYYIFKDPIYAYFNGTDWVVGEEKGTFGANAFEIKGNNFTTGTQEVRFTTNANTSLTAGGTTDRWFDDVYQVNVENMSDTEEYAVYATKPDGTVTSITSFMYHGQASGTGYNHIFALKDYIGTVAGEIVTIIAGTRFWCGNDYYTATEDIHFYYNGSCWIVGNDGTADQEITATDFTSKNYNYFEANTYKMRMHFTADTFNAQTGPLYVESGSVKVNGKAYTSLHYHGNGNMIFELIGDSLAPIGQTAFTDNLVIEAGTRIWIGIPNGSTATPFCIEFPETLEWRYVGDGMQDGGRNSLKCEWAITHNTDITLADITNMYNATDAGGEVRLGLASGILTDNFYGFMAVDTSKGIPVVNGVEMSIYSFAYGMANNLIAVRGGEYGTKLGDYIVIPKGSVWWTTQGSLTFVDEIRGVWNPSGTGAWSFGFNTENGLGTLAVDDIQQVYNYESNEIRVEVPLGTEADSYYGPISISGNAYVTKADGTVVNSVYGYWYGGASGSYTADHSLIGFQGTDIIGATNGDVFIVTADTKIIFCMASGVEGYVTFDKDLAYTFMNGSWQSGDFRGTVTYSGTNASVSGETEVLQGQPYEFTVTPDSGYAVTSVIVNGESLAITANNVYSFTAVSGENKVFVTAKKLYAVTWSNPTGATISVSANGSAISSGATVVEGTMITISVAASTGYNVTGVTVNGTAFTSGNTYTVNGETTIAATTELKTYTVTLTTTNASVSGVTDSMTITHGKTYSFTARENDTYGLYSVTIDGVEQGTDGSYSFTASGDVKIVATAKRYNVTLTTTNASVSGVTNGMTIAYGKTYSFTASANSGYGLASVTIKGTEQGASGSYSFTASSDVTIVVTAKQYTVTYTTSGDITVEAPATVAHNDSVTFKLTLPENATVTVNGVNVGTSYTVNNVKADVSVAFVTWYPVTVNAGNATVSAVSGTTNNGLYQSGTQISFTVSDTVSHRVTNVTVNNNSIGTAAGTYNNKCTVTGATTISVATTEKAKYTVSWTNPTGATITVTANETGTVTNSGTVYEGQTLTVKVQASSGYRLNTVTIGGVAQGNVSTAHAGSSTFTYTVNAATSISATTVKVYQVNWTATNATISVTSNGSSISSGAYVDTGSLLSITVAAAEHWAISGVSVNNTNVGTDAATYEHTVSGTTTITNTAVKTHYSIKFSLTSISSVSNVTDSEGATYTVSNNTTIWVPVNRTLTFAVQVSNSEMDSTSADKGTLTQTSYDGDKTYTYQYEPTAANDNCTITLKGNCIVEGTLITLADGTQKPVEDLTGDELLLVWNLETGRYDAAPIVFVDSDERMEYTVVTLYFSNGAEVGVVSEHGFFDLALGQYVYLNELNAADYIGHEFITQGSIEDNTWASATLVNVVVEQKVVKVYSPVTFSHLCYYVDGVLSMPGGIEGLFNIFEVDVETMSYDAEKMAQDIETYGLFTYEDFEGIIPEEVYEAFNGAWLKVAMGKGIIDWATIEKYATRYMPLM